MCLRRIIDVVFKVVVAVSKLAVIGTAVGIANSVVQGYFLFYDHRVDLGIGGAAHISPDCDSRGQPIV
jgi:hypothetical protein